jgi:ABC-type transport system, involved in lipoprotein release, permease component
MLRFRSKWFLAYKLFAVRWPRDVRSTLSFLSILGIALGTSLLIAILSVFNGFYEEVQTMLLSEDPHVRVTAVGAPQMVPTEDQLAWLLENEQSSQLLLRVEGKAILMGEQGSRGEPKLLTVFAESELYSTQSEEGVKEFSDDPKAPDRTDRVLYGDSDVSIRDGRPGVLIL